MIEIKFRKIDEKENELKFKFKIYWFFKILKKNLLILYIKFCL